MNRSFRILTLMAFLFVLVASSDAELIVEEIERELYAAISDEDGEIVAEEIVSFRDMGEFCVTAAVSAEGDVRVVQNTTVESDFSSLSFVGSFLVEQWRDVPGPVESYHGGYLAQVVFRTTESAQYSIELSEVLVGEYGPVINIYDLTEGEWVLQHEVNENESMTGLLFEGHMYRFAIATGVVNVQDEPFFVSEGFVANVEIILDDAVHMETMTFSAIKELFGN